MSLGCLSLPALVAPRTAARSAVPPVAGAAPLQFGGGCACGRACKCAAQLRGAALSLRRGCFTPSQAGRGQRLSGACSTTTAASPKSVSEPLAQTLQPSGVFIRHGRAHPASRLIPRALSHTRSVRPSCGRRARCSGLQRVEPARSSADAAFRWSCASRVARHHRGRRRAADRV